MADGAPLNYGWVKPEPGASDDVWGSKINDDLDAIDAKVKTIETAAASIADAPITNWDYARGSWSGNLFRPFRG